MKSCIVKEIGNQKYSIEMDSIQDMAWIDQESIILHYVLLDELNECFFAIGYGLYLLFKSILEFRWF